MIYLFVGESYFRKKLLHSWKTSFAEKFSEHNIIHVQNVFDYDLSFYQQNLLSSGFFSEKNLCILDNFPFGSDEENSGEVQKIQEFFLQLLPQIDAENIVVFNSAKVDKRSKIYKEILKIGQIKDFSIPDESQLLAKLQEVYQNKVSKEALVQMIALKGLDFSHIAGELDKILITTQKVEISDLSAISKDTEESIFEIINKLLSGNIKSALVQLRELALFLDNPYFLYNSLASNLRVYAYIFQLQILKKSNTEIKSLLDLGNRAFLVDKSYKIEKKKFLSMYQKIANIDAKMKNGKLLGSENMDMIYEIEKSLI